MKRINQLYDPVEIGFLLISRQVEVNSTLEVKFCNDSLSANVARPHIATSQLICTANQLTGFYMRATIALNKLIIYFCR